MHNSRPNPIAIRSMKIVVASAALALLVYPSIATALPPAPANDRPMDAEVISTNLPQLILGTTTSAVVASIPAASWSATSTMPKGGNQLPRA